MTADERLSILRIKIERAKEHLQQLEQDVQAFLSTTPYTIATKRDPQTRQLIYYIASVRETPIRTAAIAGDVIQNLRSALDHLAYQLVLVGMGTTPSDHVYFPIAKDAASYPSQKANQARGIRADALLLIDALRPYQGGNDALWRVHRLSIVDKHRTLLTVGSAFRSVNLGAHMHQLMQDTLKSNPMFANQTLPRLDFFVRPADRLFPLQVGTELFIDGPDAKPLPEMEFRFDVAFGEAGTINGEPLVETLKQMVDVVDVLLPTFKPYLS